MFHQQHVDFVQRVYVWPKSGFVGFGFVSWLDGFVSVSRFVFASYCVCFSPFKGWPCCLVTYLALSDSLCLSHVQAILGTRSIRCFSVLLFCFVVTETWDPNDRRHSSDVFRNPGGSFQEGAEFDGLMVTFWLPFLWVCDQP